MSTKQVLFLIAPSDFQPIEYQIPKNLIEQAGFAVTTASTQVGNATATDGSIAHVDLAIEQINIKEYDALVIIGGRGSLAALDNEKSYALIKEAYEADLIIAAICVATRILAKSGILKGKQATGWNEDKKLDDLYKEYGAYYKDTDLIVEEKQIITAVGPSAAREFAENIISLITRNNHQL